MHRRDALALTSSGMAGALLAPAMDAATALAAATPGTRAGHALAHHAGAGAVCLIGGDAESLLDTYERPWFWDGKTWSHPAVGIGPHTASLVAAAGDPERRSVLAFGGFSVLGVRQYGPPAGDLWELDASLAWRKAPADGPQPGARHHHAMAFDAARGRLVLYGGIDAADRWITDVWEWDRQRWHRTPAATGPGERAHHAMAYDARRGRVVLRGGGRRDKSRPTDTWEWDGKAWRQAALDGPGPGEGGYRMAYDAARGVTVLFGADTSEWDGRRWTRMATGATRPRARLVHALAYDPTRERVILYGGSIDRKDAGDTWEWDGSAWREPATA
jgi:hypothetical protein